MQMIGLKTVKYVFKCSTLDHLVKVPTKYD